MENSSVAYKKIMKASLMTYVSEYALLGWITKRIHLDAEGPRYAYDGASNLSEEDNTLLDSVDNRMLNKNDLGCIMNSKFAKEKFDYPIDGILSPMKAKEAFFLQSGQGHDEHYAD